MATSQSDRFAALLLKKITSEGIISETRLSAHFELQKNSHENKGEKIHFYNFQECLNHSNLLLLDLGFKITRYADEITGIVYYSFISTQSIMDDKEIEIHLKNALFNKEEIKMIKALILDMLINENYLIIEDPLAVFDTTKRNIKLSSQTRSRLVNCAVVRKLIKGFYLEIVNKEYLVFTSRFFMECRFLLSDLIREARKTDPELKIGKCSICQSDVFYYIRCSDSNCMVKLHRHCYLKWVQDMGKINNVKNIKCLNKGVEEHDLIVSEDGNYFEIMNE